MQSLKTAITLADLSSRGKRRKAATLAVALLEQIRDAEEAYLERIPDNLQGSDAYDSTDYCICLLGEAIDAVTAVYD